MTPGMQIRLWLRGAARSQVLTTFAIFAAVLALLVTSVSQGSPSSKTDALPGGGNTSVGTSPGGSLNAPGSNGAATTLGKSPTSGGAGASLLSGAPGGNGFSGSGASTGAGSAGGSIAAGGGSGGGASAGSQGFDLSKATDRGVNNCAGLTTCVKLGFLLAQIGGVTASGSTLGLRTDIDKVIAAYVAYQNKLGGLNGRPIVADLRVTDPVDETDQQNACTRFSQDDKVFATIDTAALIFAATQQCFIRDNKTPLIHGYAESEGFMEAGKGYDVTEVRSLDRIAKEWAVEIGALGFLRGGEHVGILEDNCEPSASVVANILIPGIRSFKPSSVKVYQSDCTAADAQAQPPALQNQMCIDGVDHVVLATSFVAAQTFLQSADGSPCGAPTNPKHYKYMASDYSLLASDVFDRNFSKTQFDGALGITNQFTGISAKSPELTFCSNILTGAGLPGLDNSYPNADAAAICDYFFIFVKNALAVGPDLTRAKWAQAAQNLGRFDGAFSPESIYQPNKTNGGELVHAMIWRRSCTCWQQSGPLHIGVG